MGGFLAEDLSLKFHGAGFAPSAPLTDGVGSVLDREVDSLPDELIAFIFNN